jgi:hypothetical protein
MPTAMPDAMLETAIRYKRQRHALGGQQTHGHANVDHRLNTDDARKATAREDE